MSIFDQCEKIVTPCVVQIAPYQDLIIIL